MAMGDRAPSREALPVLKRMTTTTAAVLEDNDGAFVLQEIELDEPREDEVIVRVVGCGICHSDLSARSGVTPFPLPGVLGHEGSGVVERVGARVRRVVPGDHVVLSFGSCGHCRQCDAGHPVYCNRWPVMNLVGGARPDGSPTMLRETGPLHGSWFGQSSFATRAITQERGVVKVPKELPLVTLSPLGCSVQTGVQTVLSVLRPRAGDLLAVFGAGAVGLAAIMAGARLTGATVAAVDLNPQRLELARRLGAAHIIDAGREDPVEVLRHLGEGRGADRTFEATGVPSVARQAIDALAPLGTCAIVGAPKAEATVAVSPVDLLVKGARIVGANQGDADPRTSIPALVALHAAGRLPFDELVTTYPFTDINRAVEDAAAGLVIKPVLVMPD